jgi:hypothetical protein
MSNIRNSSTTTLYNKIITTVKQLCDKYNEWPTESTDNFCDKLSVVHFDTLIKFHKNDLLDASTAIGITYDDTKYKKKDVCAAIINHYKERLILLKNIRECVELNYKKLLQAEIGPICRNLSSYVENPMECAQYEGTWRTADEYKIDIKKFKEEKCYNRWKHYLDIFDTKYTEYLERFFKIINIIFEDVENSMSDSEFEQLKSDANDSIKKMNYVCEILYLIIVNYKKQDDD